MLEQPPSAVGFISNCFRCETTESDLRPVVEDDLQDSTCQYHSLTLSLSSVCLVQAKQDYLQCVESVTQVRATISLQS